MAVALVSGLTISATSAWIGAGVEARDCLAPALLAGAAGLGSAVAVLRGTVGAPTRAARLAAVGLAMLAGLALGRRAAIAPPLPEPIAQAITGDRRPEVEGTILTAPDTAGDGSRFRMKVERVDGARVAVSALVSVANGTPAVLPGDLVSVRARLREVRGLVNPGIPDSAMPARIAGIDVFAGVGSADAITRRVTAPAHGSPVIRTFGFPLGLAWARAAAHARQALDGAIAVAAGGQVRSFLQTTILGSRRSAGEEVEAGFRAAGATHVLSVSGLHLAAVAAVVYLGLCRGLGHVPRLALWIDPRRLAAAFAVPTVAFYTSLTGAAVATVRSALMAAAGFLAIVLGRRGTPLVAIAAAVIVLCVDSPLVVFDVSFQLSVASVAALALVAPVLVVAIEGAPETGARRRQPEGRLARLGRSAALWLGRFLAASAAASVTTAPLVAHHFGEVTPASLAGNLVLVPLVELVVVPFGLAGAALGALGASAPAWLLLQVAATAARAALGVAELFRAFAPVWLTRAPNVLETVALVAAGALGLLAIPKSNSLATRRRTFAALAAAGLVVAAVSLGGREYGRRTSTDLVVTFLDIGQGDAAVVEAPGGAVILIDGGGTFEGGFDPGARVVEPFLRARGITHVDLVALSHPHPDHMNGLFRVIERFSIGTLWTSGDDGDNPEYRRLIGAAEARGIARPRPATWRTGEVTIEPLGPFSGDGQAEWIGDPEGLSVNDASLVLRAAYRDRAVLFTGDLEADGEGELRGRSERGHTVASDILKVPHHGSRTSSSDELLDVVRPRTAVMSLGWRNRFRFPRAEVVERYRRRGIAVLRTDLSGAITIRLRADGAIETTCARGCR